MKAVTNILILTFQYARQLPTTITENVVEYNLLEVAILHKLNLQKYSSTHCKILIPCLKKYFNIFMAFLFIICLFPSSYLIMIIIIIKTYFNTMSISVIIWMICLISR